MPNPPTPEGRVSTLCFRIWCEYHGRELATPVDPDSYPFFIRERGVWRIDTSEVYCPQGEEHNALTGSDTAEYAKCVNSWVVREVSDPDPELLS